MKGLARLVAGRLTAWLLIVVAVAGAGALIALAPEVRNTDDATAGLPADAQSTIVAERQQDLPSGELNPALVVYSRPGGTLGAEDLKAIAAQGTELGKIALDGRVSPPQPSPDASAAIVAVPLSGDASGEETVAAVEQIREVVRADLPDGVVAQVTGGAGFVADLNSAFAGADIRLLATTAAVVALLLLITYRSPILWIVPLAVVGLADRVTVSLVAIASQVTDLPFNASTSGIVSVLVFGAGTDYALLLIARYREELRRTPDRRAAMRDRLAGRRARHRRLGGHRDPGPAHPAAGPDRGHPGPGPGWRPGHRSPPWYSGWWCCPPPWWSARAGCSGRWCRGSTPTTRTARCRVGAGAGSAWPPPGGRSGSTVGSGAAAGRAQPGHGHHQLRPQPGRHLPHRGRVGGWPARRSRRPSRPAWSRRW